MPGPERPRALSTVPTLDADMVDVDVEGFGDAQPSRPKRQARAWSTTLPAIPCAMKAPSSIRSRPRVADSVLILGWRTHSAGEASMVPLITAKR